MKLTPYERDFLMRLKLGQRLPHADRIEDRVRQNMRKAGFATVVMNPRRWVLTEAGRLALAEGESGT